MIILNKLLTNSIWPIDKMITGCANKGQSEHGSNSNEGILHIRQSSKTAAWSLDAVYCQIQDTR